MRKNVKCIIPILILSLFSSCGNPRISQEEYDSAVEKYEDAYGKAEKYRAELDELQKDYNRCQEQLNGLEEEYGKYKEKMKEYEGLSEIETEARRIEAQRILEQQKEEEEKKTAEEEEESARKEKIGYETGISYDNLSRTPDDFEGEKVKFYGNVVQVMESPDVDYIHIRLAVDCDYDKILFCEYQKEIVKQRILVDDEITIYGTSYGLYTYESTMGGYITIPCVVIDKIDQ